MAEIIEPMPSLSRAHLARSSLIEFMNDSKELFMKLMIALVFSFSAATAFAKTGINCASQSGARLTASTAVQPKKASTPKASSGTVRANMEGKKKN